jgi:hypothetical protein
MAYPQYDSNFHSKSNLNEKALLNFQHGTSGWASKPARHPRLPFGFYLPVKETKFDRQSKKNATKT